MVAGNDKNLPSRDEFEQVVARAHRNEPGAHEALVELLDTHPQIWRCVGDSGKHVELKLVTLLTGGDPLLVESYRRQQRRLKRRLLSKSKCPLERLAVERVMLARLELAYAEMRALECSSPGDSKSQAASLWHRQLTQAQRHYDQAIRGLIDLRRLLPAKDQTSRGASNRPQQQETYRWELPAAIRKRMYGSAPRTGCEVGHS